MSLSVEEMNKQLPVANALPGEAVPYYMASGEGARYEINGQLVTVIARAADTGGIFSAAYISGGMGAESPFVTPQHRAQDPVRFRRHPARLAARRKPHPDPGRFGGHPAGNTPHAYRMASHYTRFLNWMTPGGGRGLLRARWAPPSIRTSRRSAPAASASLQEQAEVGAEFGITFPDVERVAPAVQARRRPAAVTQSPVLPQRRRG